MRTYLVAMMDLQTRYVSRPGGADRETFAELELVALLRAVTGDDGVDVPPGTVGTIVGIWRDGEAYEVECAAPAEYAARTAAVRQGIQRRRAQGRRIPAQSEPCRGWIEG